MTKRRYTDPPNMERCAQTITLRDGSQARCGRRFVDKGPWCRQHRSMLEGQGLIRQPVYCCPFCEHMPDGATARACEKHSQAGTVGWQDNVDRWGKP